MANPIARTTWALPEELSGLTADKIFETFQTDPPDRLKHLDKETGEPFDLSRSTPRQFVLECRITSIYSQKKERFGYLALFRDVTYDRKADNAMHHFISLISHKLRTPLVTIRAYPRLLLSENSVSPLNDFQRNAIETIQKQCRLMEDMVNQLIAFSSLDPDQLLCQDLTCSELVTEALKHMPEDLKDKVPLVKPDRDLAQYHVQVDPTLMQHAARNVIENAFKFGATELRVGAHAENGTVTLQFKDNGPGIPPEDRERVFDRFYQVEKTFCGQVPGAGLGLTMVKQTVEAHGGKAWVESEIGKGTTMCIRLPAASGNGQPH
jgi:signal transduction histidine kinase